MSIPPPGFNNIAFFMVLWLACLLLACCENIIVMVRGGFVCVSVPVSVWGAICYSSKQNSMSATKLYRHREIPKIPKIPIKIPIETLQTPTNTKNTYLLGVWGSREREREREREIYMGLSLSLYISEGAWLAPQTSQKIRILGIRGGL